MVIQVIKTFLAQFFPLGQGNNGRTPGNLIELQIWRHLSKIKLNNKWYHYSKLANALTKSGLDSLCVLEHARGKETGALVSSFHILFYHYLVAGLICKFPSPIQ